MKMTQFTCKYCKKVTKGLFHQAKRVCGSIEKRTGCRYKKALKSARKFHVDNPNYQKDYSIKNKKKLKEYRKKNAKKISKYYIEWYRKNGRNR